jgi:Cdc6-like AAA superfamily ATPase
MNSIRTDQITVIAGMRGTGKTEFIKKLTSTLSIPYTVYDVLNQYQGSCIEKNRYVPVNDTLDEFDNVCKKIWFKGNHLLIIEECEIYLRNKSELSEYAKQLILRGRNKNIGLWLCTRRIADLHKTPMSQANHLFLFKMYFPNDLNYISQFIPRETTEQLKTIPDYHFIRYSNGEIEICKPVRI